VSELTQDELKEILEYNEETGDLIRKCKRGRRHQKGVIVGTLRRDGYIRVHLDDKLYYAHRLIWFHMTGNWPKHQIDHINGIKNDNRFCNLREASHAANQRNKKITIQNNSGFKGVSKTSNNKRWRARIEFEGKQKYLGTFDKPEDAHQAYCKAAQARHGEFANTGV